MCAEKNGVRLRAGARHRGGRGTGCAGADRDGTYDTSGIELMGNATKGEREIILHAYNLCAGEMSCVYKWCAEKNGVRSSLGVRFSTHTIFRD